MADIRIKRGTQSQLPPLGLGEPGFTTDTKGLYIGDGVGNNFIGPADGATLSGIPRTLIELNDTPSTYDTGKYLQSTAAGSFWAAVAGIPGPPGEDSSGIWLTGVGAPASTTGTLDTFYLDTSNGDIYRKETSASVQYGVMLERESDGSYTFADAVRFVKTGHEVIIDNVDDEFSITGNWYTYNTNQAWEDSCRYATVVGSKAFFDLMVPEDGEYDVYAYWPALSNAATNAPYAITHVSGTTTIRKDQRIDGDQWNYLSTHTFDGTPTWSWKMNIKGADGLDRPTTFSGLTDTPNYYDNGKYLISTSSGIEFVDLSYYTKAEVNTISGSLQSDIDTHVSSTSNPHSVTLEQARTANNVMAGGIVFNPTVNSTVIDVSGSNLDLVWMLGHSTDGYGYYWKYEGTGSADANYLYLYSENGTGADYWFYRCHQTTQVMDIGVRLNIQDDYAVQFRDSAIYINSNDDGHLDITADTRVDVNSDLYVSGSFLLNGGYDVNIIRDEDDMGHNDENALVTQQSIKAYVDGHTSDTSIHFTDFTDLDDTPGTYDDGKYLKATTSGLEWSELLEADLPVVQVSRSTTYTLTGSYADVAWDTVIIENNTSVLEHDDSNTDNILIKETGLYMISYMISIDAASGESVFDMQVRKNDTTVLAGSLRTISEDDEINDVSNVLFSNLESGDYITYQARSAGAGDVFHTSSNFSIVRMLGVKGAKGDTGGVFDVSEDDVTVVSGVSDINFGKSFSVADNGSGKVTVKLDPKIIQCYNNTTTDYNVATPLAMQFNGEDFKDDLYTHSIVTNNSRLEVESRGIYRISYQLNFDNVTNSRTTIRARIRVNGSTYLDRGTACSYMRSTTDDKATDTASVLWELNTNDYIEIMCDRQGSSGTANTIPNQSYITLEIIRYT